MCEQFFESDGVFFFQGHFKFREEALADGMGQTEVRAVSQALGRAVFNDPPLVKQRTACPNPMLESGESFSSGERIEEL